MPNRISLGVCSDEYVPKLIKAVRKGKIQSAAEGIIMPNNKTYYVGSSVVYTNAEKEGLGKVHKMYSEHSDGSWHLQRRQVQNERGRYARRVEDSGMIDAVSLGGQAEYVKLSDGTYLQEAYAHFPQRIVSSQEIEAAIDYVKGHGSVENYEKLLRNYKA